MAKIKSAIKRARQAETRRQRNRSVKSGILTITKKVRTAIESGNKDEAEKLLPQFTSTVDKAAKKGVIPKNTASRKKSRMALNIAKMA